MFRFVSEYYIILIMTTTVIVWAMQEVETSSLIWSTTVLDIETDNLSILHEIEQHFQVSLCAHL